MCKRPSPDMLFRTCKGAADGGPVILPGEGAGTGDMAIAKGTTVYLPLASAPQGAIMAEAECPGSLAEGTMVVFGGERGKGDAPDHARSEEHTSELQSLMRTSYAVFCLTKTHNTPHRMRHATTEKTQT